MAEKYISSAWLLETIEDYKNISCWNTEHRSSGLLQRTHLNLTIFAVTENGGKNDGH